MAKTIIEALREYFLGCPLMGDSRLNIDYLPEDTLKGGVEYSIDPVPSEAAGTQFMSRSSISEYLFVIRSVNDYCPDAAQNIENSGFYEELACWLLMQERAKNLPGLPGGMAALKLGTVSTGYLFNAMTGAGKYQIQCKLTYFREGER